MIILRSKCKNNNVSRTKLILYRLASYTNVHCYFVNNTTIGKLNNLIAFMEFKTNHVYTVFAIFVAYETQAMSQEIRKVTN